jgi:hypothetical protein
MESLTAALNARGQRAAIQEPAITMPSSGRRTDGE